MGNKRNLSVLEVKYGNLYGGFPNFFSVSEISLLVFEPDTKRIFIETWINQADVDYVSVVAKTDELGHTVDRVKEVINMRTGRKKAFDEEYKLGEEDIKNLFFKVRPAQKAIKGFLLKNFRKYNVNTILTFDGRRDIFLCEKAGVDFRRTRIVDLQRELNSETNYLFSLNKLSVVIDFRMENSYLRSNNLEFWLHPIAAKQLYPGNAAYDAARLFMVNQEYREFHDDFLVKAQLLLNKIQAKKS
ncbi:MAG: hypothetical protein R2769_07580 [Saprospiraceae bacterium]